MGVLRQPPRCWPGTLGTERWVTLIFRSQKDRAVTVRGVSVAECSCSRGGKRVCRGGRTAGTLGLLPAERASADPTCTRPGAECTRCLSPPPPEPSTQPAYITHAPNRGASGGRGAQTQGEVPLSSRPEASSHFRHTSSATELLWRFLGDVPWSSPETGCRVSPRFIRCGVSVRMPAGRSWTWAVGVP